VKITPFSFQKTRSLLGLLLVTVSFLGPGCRETGLDLKDVPLLLSQKLEVLSRMRVDLLKSVEAEKSAVMADTDEASQAYALQARKAADRVEQGRREFRRLLDKDHTAQELKLLQEFDGAWPEFLQTDKTILDFAVQNTNLKAARLSFGPGRETLGRLEKAIGRLTSGQPLIERAACRILTAGWEILALHAPHIAASEDQRMDEIEAALRRLQTEMADSFRALKSRIPPGKQADLQETEKAFKELQKITAQVIAWSRQNTNIKSFELSLGRKRKISARCDEILAALEEAVRSQGFKATR
jgi:hypothetical protein